MEITFEHILNVMTLIFGAGGIVAYIGARKERRAQTKIVEASATLEMQKSYAQYVLDNNQVICELKIELKEVKAVLKNYVKQCQLCTNNKIES